MDVVKELDLRLRGLSRNLTLGLAFVLVCLLGLLDYFTSRDLVFSTLDLIPICWVTWCVNRKAGWAFSILSVIVWTITDYATGYDYSHFFVPIWNILMLLGMFIPIVAILAAFQQAYVGLEETVAVRTKVLRKEIAERKRAERANLRAARLATVGLMAAQVAHEVRNPLGAIALTLDLVESEIHKISTETERSLEESTELLGSLRREVRRIEMVISDYLALARPRSATLTPLDLNDLLRRKFAFMNGVFSDANIQLKLNLESHPLLLNADGDQIWQAILNIARNGLEAMSAGGTLTVQTFRNADSVVLQLSDTGCGMTPAQMDKMFVPFATSKVGGTGLGLTVVDQIVTEHRGHIECHTTSEEGTTFTFTFPRADESLVPPTPTVECAKSAPS